MQRKNIYLMDTELRLLALNEIHSRIRGRKALQQQLIDEARAKLKEASKLNKLNEEELDSLLSGTALRSLVAGELSPRADLPNNRRHIQLVRT